MDTTEGYDGISTLIKSLSQADLGSYTEADIAQAEKLEAYVTRKVVFTAEMLAMYFGKIDGKWYLLVIDAAAYDCSA